MDSNHRCLGVSQESLPLDHGTEVFKWTHRDSHPDFWRAEPVSSCWTMSPIVRRRKPWDSNPQAAQGRHLFSRQAPHPSGRMTSVVWRRLNNSGGWNRTNDLLVQSQASLPTATTPELSSRFRTAVTSVGEIRGEGLEPPSPGSKPGSLPLADPEDPRYDPTRRKCPPGVEPAWPAWKAGAFAARPRARLQSGRRGSRTLKASYSRRWLDCFRDSCHRQLACPSVSLQRLRWQESNLRRSG